jgi:hypothetical protein
MGLHDEALKQIEGHWQRLWNPEKKLIAHIWDEGFRPWAVQLTRKRQSGPAI